MRAFQALSSLIEISGALPQVPKTQALRRFRIQYHLRALIIELTSSMNESALRGSDSHPTGLTLSPKEEYELLLKLTKLSEKFDNIYLSEGKLKSGVTFNKVERPRFRDYHVNR